eukprot:9531916-Alexandrium_andersonii.AAC.1
MTPDKRALDATSHIAGFALGSPVGTTSKEGQPPQTIYDEVHTVTPSATCLLCSMAFKCAMVS